MSGGLKRETWERDRNAEAAALRVLRLVDRHVAAVAIPEDVRAEIAAVLAASTDVPDSARSSTPKER